MDGLWTCGKGQNGKLGHGDKADRLVLKVSAEHFEGNAKIVSVAAGAVQRILSVIVFVFSEIIPHRTKISSCRWYTCSVRWSLPPDIQNMLSIMGKAQDDKIA